MNPSIPSQPIRRNLPLLLTLSSLLLGCVAASRSLPLPEELLAASAAAPDADLQTLRAGRALAVTSCSSCHRLYWPDEYPADAWKGIVNKMGPMASLNAGQRASLLAYLQAAARISRTPAPPTPNP